MRNLLRRETANGCQGGTPVQLRDQPLKASQSPETYAGRPNAQAIAAILSLPAVRRYLMLRTHSPSSKVTKLTKVTIFHG